MDIKDIQKAIDVMPAAMAAKGKRLPDAAFELLANAEPVITLRSARPGKTWADDWHYVKADTLDEMLDAANEWIAALPTAEETRMKEFMTALSDVIELGRKSGVDVEFVNPLVATMRSLSTNIIADHRVAA